MQITLNDEPHDLPDGTTIAGLLELLGKSNKYLAVERNRELVPRGRHAECVLEEGDRVEIVTLVGGG
ncbi:sulfur carrier protein ThiS [Stratiformator vulcanicus]|uniref:Sulfur carrier protein ThiS n=1 Tax=Stratiformator vulcanicus TaxID=2527980 RepID=A0A517R4K1_9PLAN|nr:sulfur carrier protein ThiS [Stratiformator vulcanicus]QDT38753.1 Sulfur carrier protein ThiS [Stratiformator vulcanicus]